MKAMGRSRDRRRRRALRLGLLMLPALFWSGVFAALAGVRPLERILERVTDPAQLFIVLACPLLAAALGVQALGRGGVNRDGGRPDFGRFTMSAALVLTLFAVLAALRPA